MHVNKASRGRQERQKKSNRERNGWGQNTQAKRKVAGDWRRGRAAESGLRSGERFLEEGLLQKQRGARRRGAPPSSKGGWPEGGGMAGVGDGERRVGDGETMG
jgi:hypothetical protein